jgi:hypothetical protein
MKLNKIDNVRTLHCGEFSLPFFPRNCNSTFLFYCWHSCSCQQYKSVHCCHVNITVGFLCGVVELQNILFCCKNNKCEIWVHVSVALIICNKNHIFFLRYYIVICGLPGFAIFFSHFLINDTIFRHLWNVHLFWFSLQFLSETFRRIQWDDVINLRRTSHKVPIILVRFEWNLNFFDIL